MKKDNVMARQPLPRITVVTPSYNQVKYIEKAICSVIEQGYSNLEYIVMDGGSTDGSADIIAKYDRDLTYWTTENDNGQSDALHRGFMRGTGEILTWLNSDDILLPGTLADVARTFMSDQTCQCVFGNVVWISAEGKILRCRKGEAYWSILPRLAVLNAYGPSAFFSRELYIKVGGLNTELHYMMDTELWWRFAIAGAGFHRLKRYSWALRLHSEAKVSGHMFPEASSYMLDKARQAQEVEYKHLLGLIASYQKSWAKPAKNLIQTALRISSPQYIRGLYDHAVWSGKPIEKLMLSQ
jgi:glycosyltransferase involved in cell wall biosynthesis